MTQQEAIYMTDTTITLRVPQDLKNRLEALGSSYKRTKSYLALEAIQRYVETEEEYIEGIKEARADIKAGRTFTTDEVFASIDKIINRQKATA
jgi:predicted transcriptional regulator